MPNHFSAIGFTINDVTDINTLVGHMSSSVGEEMACPQGMYLLWRQDPGIELWANRNNALERYGVNPHFSGVGRVKVAVTTIVHRVEDYPLESTLIGRMNSDDPNSEETPPVVIDMPDYDLKGDAASPGAVVMLQVAAFAHELACYPTEQIYLDSQEEEPRFSPEFYIPTSMFTTEPGVPRAFSMLAGHVRESRLIVNPHTGQKFHHLVITSLLGTLDVVADPAIVDGQPVVGGVVRGSFWLSGRLVDQ